MYPSVKTARKINPYTKNLLIAGIADELKRSSNRRRRKPISLCASPSRNVGPLTLRNSGRASRADKYARLLETSGGGATKPSRSLRKFSIRDRIALADEKSSSSVKLWTSRRSPS